jgi:hypothetical protein
MHTTTLIKCAHTIALFLYGIHWRKHENEIFDNLSIHSVPRVTVRRFP